MTEAETRQRHKREWMEATLGEPMGFEEWLMQQRDAQAAQIQQLQIRLGLSERAYKRLSLCPDHRDKASGTCIVCQAETRARDGAQL